MYGYDLKTNHSCHIFQTTWREVSRKVNRKVRIGLFEKQIHVLIPDELIDGEAQLNAANSNVTWRQGRQLLRQ